MVAQYLSTTERRVQCIFLVVHYERLIVWLSFLSFDSFFFVSHISIGISFVLSSADNTDLCYNELTKAPYSNDIDANGFSVYDDEGPVHCHGFAWSTDEREASSRYKANNLFFVSMYDHMYERGYVGNIPGSPMCGCVETVSADIFLWHIILCNVIQVVVVCHALFIVSYIYQKCP